MSPHTCSCAHTCAKPETVDVYWNSNFNRTAASSYQLTGWIVVLLPELSIKSGLHVCEARRNHEDRNLPFVLGNTTWPLATLVYMRNKLSYVWGVVSWHDGVLVWCRFLARYCGDSLHFSYFFFAYVMCGAFFPLQSEIICKCYFIISSWWCFTKW